MTCNFAEPVSTPAKAAVIVSLVQLSVDTLKRMSTASDGYFYMFTNKSQEGRN